MTCLHDVVLFPSEATEGKCPSPSLCPSLMKGQGQMREKNLTWKHLSSGTHLETGKDSASLLLSHHPYAALSSSTQTHISDWLK